MGANCFKRDKFLIIIQQLVKQLYTALALKLNEDDVIVQLVPNCPLRTIENIINSYNFLKI